MKKLMITSLILAAALALLTGCGKAENTEEKSAAVEAAPQKVELKVFMSFPRFKEQFEAYFEQFREKELAEKNIDVTVKLEMPNADQANQILKTRMASNDSPDVFTLHAIADIPDYYKAGYLSDLSSQPFADKLFDSVRKTVTYNGKVVALPLESLSWGYLYNREIFSRLNLTPPETLDEMEAVISVLKKNDITPFLLAFQESWIPQLMMALSLGGVVSSENPDFIESMNAGTGSYKDVSAVFDIIDIIMKNGTAKPFEVGSAAGSADFANGKAAMWVQGPWMAETILKVNPDMQIGVAPLPVSDNPAGAMINLATSTSLAVSPDSKNREAALDLVNYLLDETDSAPLFEALKFNPVADMHTYESFPWVEEASKYVSMGKAYQDLSLPGGVTGETAKMLQSYYTGSVSKADIIAALDKAWADSLKTAVQ